MKMKSVALPKPRMNAKIKNEGLIQLRSLSIPYLEIGKVVETDILGHNTAVEVITQRDVLGNISSSRLVYINRTTMEEVLKNSGIGEDGVFKLPLPQGSTDEEILNYFIKELGVDLLPEDLKVTDLGDGTLLIETTDKSLGFSGNVTVELEEAEVIPSTYHALLRVLAPYDQSTFDGSTFPKISVNGGEPFNPMMDENTPVIAGWPNMWTAESDGYILTQLTNLTDRPVRVTLTEGDFELGPANPNPSADENLLDFVLAGRKDIVVGGHQVLGEVREQYNDSIYTPTTVIRRDVMDKEYVLQVDGKVIPFKEAEEKGLVSLQGSILVSHIPDTNNSVTIFWREYFKGVKEIVVPEGEEFFTRGITFTNVGVEEVEVPKLELAPHLIDSEVEYLDLVASLGGGIGEPPEVKVEQEGNTRYLSLNKDFSDYDRFMDGCNLNESEQVFTHTPTKQGVKSLFAFRMLTASLDAMLSLPMDTKAVTISQTSPMGEVKKTYTVGDLNRLKVKFSDYYLIPVQVDGDQDLTVAINSVTDVEDKTLFTYRRTFPLAITLVPTLYVDVPVEVQTNALALLNSIGSDIVAISPEMVDEYLPADRTLDIDPNNGYATRMIDFRPTVVKEGVYAFVSTYKVDPALKDYLLGQAEHFVANGITTPMLSLGNEVDPNGGGNDPLNTVTLTEFDAKAILDGNECVYHYDGDIYIFTVNTVNVEDPDVSAKTAGYVVFTSNLDANPELIELDPRSITYEGIRIKKKNPAEITVDVVEDIEAYATKILGEEFDIDNYGGPINSRNHYFKEGPADVNLVVKDYGETDINMVIVLAIKGQGLTADTPVYVDGEVTDPTNHILEDGVIFLLVTLDSSHKQVAVAISDDINYTITKTIAIEAGDIPIAGIFGGNYIDDEETITDVNFLDFEDKEVVTVEGSSVSINKATTSLVEGGSLVEAIGFSYGTFTHNQLFKYSPVRNGGEEDLATVVIPLTVLVFEDMLAARVAAKPNELALTIISNGSSFTLTNKQFSDSIVDVPGIGRILPVSVDLDGRSLNPEDEFVVEFTVKSAWDKLGNYERFVLSPDLETDVKYLDQTLEARVEFNFVDGETEVLKTGAIELPLDIIDENGKMKDGAIPLVSIDGGEQFNPLTDVGQPIDARLATPAGNPTRYCLVLYNFGDKAVSLNIEGNYTIPEESMNGTFVENGTFTLDVYPELEWVVPEDQPIEDLTQHTHYTSFQGYRRDNLDKLARFRLDGVDKTVSELLELGVLAEPEVGAYTLGPSEASNGSVLMFQATGVVDEGDFLAERTESMTVKLIHTP